MDQKYNIIWNLIDKTKAGFASINTSLDKTAEKAKKAEKEIGLLGKMFNKFFVISAGDAINALRGIGDALVGVLAKGNNIIMFRTQLQTLLKDVGEVTKMENALKEFAQTTPFEIEPLRKYTQQLLAMGFTADKIIPTLTNVGNISMGDPQKIETLVESFGRMKAMDRVQMEQLNRMSEAGVPILEKLAEKRKQSTRQLLKDIELQKVSFKDLDETVKAMATGNGMYAGGMQAIAKTARGMWSNIKDVATLGVGKVGENILDRLVGKDNNGPLSQIAKNTKTISSAFESFNSVLNKVFDNFSRFVSMLSLLFIPAIKSIVSAFIALPKVLINIPGTIALNVVAFNNLSGVFAKLCSAIVKFTVNIYYLKDSIVILSSRVLQFITVNSLFAISWVKSTSAVTSFFNVISRNIAWMVSLAKSFIVMDTSSLLLISNIGKAAAVFGKFFVVLSKWSQIGMALIVGFRLLQATIDFFAGNFRLAFSRIGQIFEDIVIDAGVMIGKLISIMSFRKITFFEDMAVAAKKWASEYRDALIEAKKAQKDFVDAQKNFQVETKVEFDPITGQMIVRKPAITPKHGYLPTKGGLTAPKSPTSTQAKETEDNSIALEEAAKEAARIALEEKKRIAELDRYYNKYYPIFYKNYRNLVISKTQEDEKYLDYLKNKYGFEYLNTLVSKNDAIKKIYDNEQEYKLYLQVKTLDTTKKYSQEEVDAIKAANDKISEDISLQSDNRIKKVQDGYTAFTTWFSSVYGVEYLKAEEAIQKSGLEIYTTIDTTKKDQMTGFNTWVKDIYGKEFIKLTEELQKEAIEKWATSQEDLKLNFGSFITWFKDTYSVDYASANADLRKAGLEEWMTLDEDQRLFWNQFLDWFNTSFGVSYAQANEDTKKAGIEKWATLSDDQATGWNSFLNWFKETYSVDYALANDKLKKEGMNKWNGVTEDLSNPWTNFTNWLGDTWSSLFGSSSEKAKTEGIGKWSGVTEDLSNPWTDFTNWLGDTWGSLFGVSSEKAKTEGIGKWSGTKDDLSIGFLDFNTWFKDTFGKDFKDANTTLQKEGLEIWDVKTKLGTKWDDFVKYYKDTTGKDISTASKSQIDDVVTKWTDGLKDLSDTMSDATAAFFEAPAEDKAGAFFKPFKDMAQKASIDFVKNIFTPTDAIGAGISGLLTGGITSIFSGLFNTIFGPDSRSKTVAEMAAESFEEMVDRTNEALDKIGKKQTLAEKQVDVLEKMKKNNEKITPEKAVEMGISKDIIDKSGNDITKMQKLIIEYNKSLETEKVKLLRADVDYMSKKISAVTDIQPIVKEISALNSKISKDELGINSPEAARLRGLQSIVKGVQDSYGLSVKEAYNPTELLKVLNPQLEELTQTFNLASTEGIGKIIDLNKERIALSPTTFKTTTEMQGGHDPSLQVDMNNPLTQPGTKISALSIPSSRPVNLMDVSAGSVTSTTDKLLNNIYSSLSTGKSTMLLTDSGKELSKAIFYLIQEQQSNGTLPKF